MPQPRRSVPSPRVMRAGGLARAGGHGRLVAVLVAAAMAGPLLSTERAARAQFAVGPGRAPSATGTVPGARQVPIAPALPPGALQGLQALQGLPANSLQATLLLQRQLLYAQALLLSSQQSAALGAFAAANGAGGQSLGLTSPGPSSLGTVGDAVGVSSSVDLASPGALPPPPPAAPTGVQAPGASMVSLAPAIPPQVATSSAVSRAAPASEPAADAKAPPSPVVEVTVAAVADAGAAPPEPSSAAVLPPPPAAVEVPGAVTIAEYLEPLAAAATRSPAPSQVPTADQALASRAALPSLDGPLGSTDIMAAASRPFSSVQARLGVVVAALLLIAVALGFTRGRREPPA